ncbi:riboflavin biosynthesis protein RibF [Alkalihalophilus pseudofirmus]|uniref:bifunctional riboflavin kinase/FAD synthetase n=1 Tax=Alkalihalobacterium alkalinitrilicum TaxID=427920 RepID=UPI00094C1AE2|nr:bifunctional riboflavin kinase/FAD synthetase [Alkalihalobacterium alkalinitrilicum]OLO40936.1 riboflavin biosynthesis protein RibF [Alkalihalophilus pseudofirmus]
MDVISLSYPLQLKNEKPTVMALGYFDGVHIGHQKVIQTAKNTAFEKGLLTSVMTFNPHPKEVLRKPSETMMYITPLEKKIEVIEKLGVDQLFVVHFDEGFSKLTPQQFVDDFLIDMNVKHVVAGFDYSYGHLGKGNMETLPFHARGVFEQTTVNKVELQEHKISSTLIRNKIANGEVGEIVELLGRYYEVEGIVVHGDKRGRTIGFPTANIRLSNRYIIPKLGVYAVTLIVNGQTYEGVCNIGYRPTFKEQEAVPSIEVYLFDFDDDIYDQNITLSFHHFLRSEKKFSSKEELVQQINVDKASTEMFFQENKAK